MAAEHPLARVSGAAATSPQVSLSGHQLLRHLVAARARGPRQDTGGGLSRCGRRPTVGACLHARALVPVLLLAAVGLYAALGLGHHRHAVAC